MRGTAASPRPPASSLLYSANRAPSPSHIRYLADRPECTKLLHGFLIFTNKPASAQCSRPYRCGSGARGPLHRIQSPPSQICISLRTAPDGNLNLMTACSLCPHHHRSAWALSHCLEFGEPPQASDPLGHCQDSPNRCHSTLQNYKHCPEF